MRWFFLVYLLVVILCVGLFGWKGQKSSRRPFEVFQDMDHQRKVKAQQPSDFFADGLGSRLPVPGTVPMGWAVATAVSLPDGSDLPGGYFRSGTFGDFFGEGFPRQVTVDKAMLDRGKERYGIYCTVCHGQAGDGKGVVGPYWIGGMMPPTANLIDERVKGLPEGQIYWTITHGKGLMGPYSGNISVEDRWAIVAYLRVLQASASADPNDPEVKKVLEQAEAQGTQPVPAGRAS